MPFGHLTKPMEAAIRALVEGQRVVDLGSGDLAYAERLLRLGASHVWAVDKHYLNGRPPESQPNLTVVPGYYVDVGPNLPLFDVAFLSWPSNQRMPGLIEILERTKVVIYLGSNTDGSACGFSRLYEHLVGRRLIVAMEHRRNTLIAVEESLSEPRIPTLEEFCGFDPTNIPVTRVQVRTCNSCSRVVHSEGEGCPNPECEDHKPGVLGVVFPF